MPELPEVEFCRRGLERWTLSRPIGSVEMLDPKALVGDLAHLQGRSFVEWERRGKLLLGHLKGGWTLASHLGMTGKWVADPARDRRHQRLVLELAGDGVSRVALVDARRFGGCWLMPTAEVDDWARVKRLGPDLMDDRLTPDLLGERVGGDDRPLKRRLMDQGVVAGLGNIMVAEACWRAQVHPHHPTRDLAADDWRRLLDSARAHVRDVLADEQGDEIAYVNSTPGGGPSTFSCYGRGGEPCLRCGATLAAGRLDGRASTWCPTCQPGGA